MARRPYGYAPLRHFWAGRERNIGAVVHGVERGFFHVRALRHGDLVRRLRDVPREEIERLEIELRALKAWGRAARARIRAFCSGSATKAGGSASARSIRAAPSACAGRCAATSSTTPSRDPRIAVEAARSRPHRGGFDGIRGLLAGGTPGRPTAASAGAARRGHRCRVAGRPTAAATRALLDRVDKVSGAAVGARQVRLIDRFKLFGDRIENDVNLGLRQCGLLLVALSCRAGQ